MLQAIMVANFADQKWNLRKFTLGEYIWQFKEKMSTQFAQCNYGTNTTVGHTQFPTLMLGWDALGRWSIKHKKKFGG